MTSRDFVYWLQGFFELAGHSTIPHGEVEDLTAEQVACIQRHLNMVFEHDIDPSMGDQSHRDKLSDIHAAKKTMSTLTLEQRKSLDEALKEMEEQSPFPTSGFNPGCGPGCPGNVRINC